MDSGGGHVKLRRLVGNSVRLCSGGGVVSLIAAYATQLDIDTGTCTMSNPFNLSLTLSRSMCVYFPSPYKYFLLYHVIMPSLQQGVAVQTSRWLTVGRAECA